MQNPDQLVEKYNNISRKDLRSLDKYSISSDETVSNLDKAVIVTNLSLNKSNCLNPTSDSDEWDYNICRKEDLKYFNEDDLISSDETISDLDSIGKSEKIKLPKKFNQLNPTTKFIHKLLSSAKSKTKSIWRIVELSQTSIDSSYRNSSCGTIMDSSERMDEKSSKRKRKHHSIDEEELLHSHRKKVKRTNNNDIRPTKGFVNRKEQAHSVSSSDSECDRKPPSKSALAETTLKGNNHKNESNPLLTSDEDYSSSKGKSSKKQKSVNKPPDITNIKKDRNHLLSSDEGSSSDNSIPKSSANGELDQSKLNHSMSNYEGRSNSLNKSSTDSFKVLKTSSKQFIKSEPADDVQSDLDSQIIETDQSNEDSSFEEKPEPQNINITTHFSNKSDQKLSFSQKDEEELSKYALLLDTELTEKNNVWILQCPSSLDCADLVGQSLDLTGKGSARLKAGSTMFEAYSYRDHTSRSATLAVPLSSNQLHTCKIPVTGNIIIEESVDIINKKSFTIPDPPQCVELPQNLRTRHPLLGVDYEREVTTSSFPKRKKSSKKKKHSKSFNESSYSNGVQEDDLETPLEEREVKMKKKHKKKKHSNYESN